MSKFLIIIRVVVAMIIIVSAKSLIMHVNVSLENIRACQMHKLDGSMQGTP